VIACPGVARQAISVYFFSAPNLDSKRACRFNLNKTPSCLTSFTLR
jgi:hypothetical protein